MTTLIYDNFNRTTSSPNAGTAFGGRDANLVYQTQIGAAHCDGSTLVIEPDTGGTRLHVGTPTAENLDVYVEVSNFSTNATLFKEFGILMRYFSDDTFYLFRYVNDQNLLDTGFALEISQILDFTVLRFGLLGRTRTSSSFKMRCQVETLPDRVALRMKHWFTGSEPALWTLDVVDTTANRIPKGTTSNGTQLIVLRCSNEATSDMQIDNLFVQTLNTTPAYVAGDRVKETTTTTGTGDLTLDGAVSGFDPFWKYADRDDRVAYTIVNGTEWEVGVGTWTWVNILQRTTVLASSNAGALVNFSAGTKEVSNVLSAAQGALPAVSRLQNSNLVVPRDTTTYVPDSYEIRPQFALELSPTAGMEIG